MSNANESWPDGMSYEDVRNLPVRSRADILSTTWIGEQDISWYSDETGRYSLIRQSDGSWVRIRE